MVSVLKTPVTAEVVWLRGILFPPLAAYARGSQLVRHPLWCALEIPAATTRPNTFGPTGSFLWPVSRTMTSRLVQDPNFLPCWQQEQFAITALIPPTLMKAMHQLVPPKRGGGVPQIWRKAAIPSNRWEATVLAVAATPATTGGQQNTALCAAAPAAEHRLRATSVPLPGSPGRRERPCSYDCVHRLQVSCLRAPRQNIRFGRLRGVEIWVCLAWAFHHRAQALVVSIALLSHRRKQQLVPPEPVLPQLQQPPSSSGMCRTTILEGCLWIYSASRGLQASTISYICPSTSEPKPRWATHL
mmetsp:Transcript_66166/g.138214  ORF Transcript_66166/g.138214 Transcript_66166/m.138214 type:complete len:300 (+) Transcript_66166:140-1039(+)